jgi:heme-degrading monooxygenase HmoA
MYTVIFKYRVIKGREKDFEKFFKRILFSKGQLKVVKGFIKFQILKGIIRENFTLYAFQYYFDSEDDCNNWINSTWGKRVLIVCKQTDYSELLESESEGYQITQEIS